MKGDVRLDSASFEPGSPDGPWRSIQVRRKSNRWGPSAHEATIDMSVAGNRERANVESTVSDETWQGAKTQWPSRCGVFAPHARRRWSIGQVSDRRCADLATGMVRPIEPSVGEARQPPTRTLKRGDGKGPVWSRSGRGLSPRQAPRWSDPPPDSECPRGPKTSDAAPSGARRQARGTERVISPAHLRWALRGIPAEVGVEETACGLGPGRSPPPTDPFTCSNRSAHDLSHLGAIAVQDIHFILQS